MRLRDRDHFCKQDIAGVVVLIGAGREHGDMVCSRDSDIAAEIGKALHFLHIIHEFDVIGKIKGVYARICIGHKAAEYGEAIIPRGGVEIEIWVRVVVILLFVVDDRGEHAAVVHVVPVEDRAAAVKAEGISCIDKDRTAGIPGAVNKAVQIIVVIAALDDRIVDDGVGTVDPADHVAVFGQQGGKIHVDRGALQGLCSRWPTGAWTRCGNGTGISVRPGVSGCGGGAGFTVPVRNKFAGESVVHSGGLPIFEQR